MNRKGFAPLVIVGIIAAVMIAGAILFIVAHPKVNLEKQTLPGILSAPTNDAKF